MKGKVTKDLAYCEIFNEYDAPPEDIALQAGFEFDILNSHDGTYLALLQDGDALAYATIPADHVEIVKESKVKKITKKQLHEQEIEEVKTRLRAMINPGDTIYTSLKHVSRSGMYRVIRLYVMVDNHPQNIDWLASQLLEGYDDRHEGCKASGCGMDMGFALVYHLSYSLRYEYPCIGYESKKPGENRCSSPDHINSGPDRDNESYWLEHGHRDGYALKHQWM